MPFIAKPSSAWHVSRFHKNDYFPLPKYYFLFHIISISHECQICPFSYVVATDGTTPLRVMLRLSNHQTYTHLSLRILISRFAILLQVDTA